VYYESEVWQIKEKTKKLLTTTEMDFWKRSAGRSRRERVTNTNSKPTRIREIMGVKHTIINDIKTKQLVWYDHVQRMPDDKIPKQVLNWRPYGRRRRGRLRRSWREGIDREIKLRDLADNMWKDRER
jgi:hypothetical protein